MRNEFLPTKKERDDNAKKIADLEQKISSYETEKIIAERLIDEGLRAPDDEIDEHLTAQFSAIHNDLYFRDTERTLDLIAMGYEVDTLLQDGLGIGEATLEVADRLQKVAEEVLKIDFVKVDEDATRLTVGRVIDLYRPGARFIDVFIEAIKERRKIMSGLEERTYVIDTRTGTVEPKKTDKKT